MGDRVSSIRVTRVTCRDEFQQDVKHIIGLPHALSDQPKRCESAVARSRLMHNVLLQNTYEEQLPSRGKTPPQLTS